jgi:hypothetical protein
MVDAEGNEYTLTVEQDEYAEDPREWDNLCTMVCWHSRYSLGDKHNFNDEWDFLQDLCEELLGMEYEDCEDMTKKEMFQKLVDSGKIIIKPINIYDHSGITVSTSNGYPYNDRWDGGWVGFIYVTKDRIFKECCNITEENWKERADRYIEGEMETYDMYVRGEVYQFSLTKKVIVQDKCPHCGEVIREYEDEEEIDSCCGFYGDCLEENGILGNISDDIKFMED